MKQGFLKISGIAAILFLTHSVSPAQTITMDTLEKSKTDKMGDYDEIIIKKKGDKDIKITVEIKDGTVLINGKPVDEFDDDNISVRKKNINVVEDGQVYTFVAPPPPTPFRGSWSHAGNSYNGHATAFLGVSTEKSETVSGAAIKEVTKSSAAEKAGLKKGDIITKIDDNKIESPSDLVETIQGYEPAKKVTVTYKRAGKEQKVPVTLGKSTVAYSKTYNFSMPEMNENFKFNMNDAEMPKVYGWDYNRELKIGIKAQDTEDGKGVKVLDVDDESAAEKAGIKEDDIITQFDGQDVNDAEALARLARAAKTKPSVKVKLTRDGKPMDIVVKIPKKLKTTNL